MNKQAKRSTVGGQGVLGGVMMRSPKKAALAVRKQDGAIAVKTWEAGEAEPGHNPQRHTLTQEGQERAGREGSAHM